MQQSPPPASTETAYAEILAVRGSLSLLRLHLRPEAGHDAQDWTPDKVYFVIVEGETLRFASERPDLVERRFKAFMTPAGDTPGKVDRTADGTAGEDFLESQPTQLPTVRGEGYDKLVAQLSQWLQREQAH